MQRQTAHAFSRVCLPLCYVCLRVRCATRHSRLPLFRNTTRPAGARDTDAGDEAAHALDVQGLTKRYGGVLALDGASLECSRGEVHGVVGENGAGKSTFVKILSGGRCCRTPAACTSTAARLPLDGVSSGLRAGGWPRPSRTQPAPRI